MGHFSKNEMAGWKGLDKGTIRGWVTDTEGTKISPNLARMNRSLLERMAEWDITFCSSKWRDDSESFKKWFLRSGTFFPLPVFLFKSWTANVCTRRESKTVKLFHFKAFQMKSGYDLGTNSIRLLGDLIPSKSDGGKKSGFLEIINAEFCHPISDISWRFWPPKWGIIPP